MLTFDVTVVDMSRSIIGEMYGRKYFLIAKPGMREYSETHDVNYEEREGAVSLSITYRREGDEKEIVRIDNSHGHMHMHRFYSEQENEEKLEMDYHEALKHLMENWKRYAREFEKKR